MQKVIYTGGAFDLLHVGHLALLYKAKALGDYLVVSVMSNEFVERTKGRLPIIPAQQRLEIVGALRCVDDVGIAIDHTDYRIIDLFRPAIRVVGPEWGKCEGEAKALDEMLRRGIEIVIIGRTPNISTTEIIERIQSG